MRKPSAGAPSLDPRRLVRRLGEIVATGGLTAEDGGQVQPLFSRTFQRLFIARIGVAHNARRWIIPQHPFETPGGILGPVGNDDHPSVLRKAHADPAAMVQADPGRAAGRVEQGIEQRVATPGRGFVSQNPS